MLSRQFVRTKIMQLRPDFRTEQVDQFIDEAVRLLGNLVHYRNGGPHEDDDVVTTVLVIRQDIQ